MAWPFLVFLAPVFGPALHGAKATGYDMTGLCVPRLTNSRIRRKNALDQQRAKVAQRMEYKEWSSPWTAAWRKSDTRRWVYALVGLLPPVRWSARKAVEKNVMI